MKVVEVDATFLLHHLQAEGAQHTLQHLTQCHRLAVFVEEVVLRHVDAVEQRRSAGRGGGDMRLPVRPRIDLALLYSQIEHGAQLDTLAVLPRLLEGDTIEQGEVAEGQ